MQNLGSWLLEEESGQGMVEYGLIIALIAVVVIGAVAAIGRALNTKFNDAADAIQAPPAGP